MWPERLHDRITHHPGPTLIVAEALFGGSYLIASLSSERRPLIWLELASHDASDAVMLGNRLSAALTRALGSNLISKALPYPAVVAALRRDAPFLGPLTLAASGVHHAPDLARALLDLHSPDLRVVLEAPHRPPGVALASEVLIVQPSDLGLTHEEARQFAGDSLGLELEATEELLEATDGAYEPFMIALSERLGLPTPLRPGPEGPRFAPGTEPEVDPEALFDVLLERRRWLAALELAVSTLPDRTPQVLVRAGHTLNGSGLHGRMWELLEALPKILRRHETVLFWRPAAAFRVGQLEAVLPEVRWHLERFEAPELRALHAGTTLAPAQALAEVERAYGAAQTPLTAFHLGRLRAPAEGVPILRQAVKLAEAEGPSDAVVRNAGALASQLLHLGEYREAISWSRWALGEFERLALEDGQRRARIVNTWAYARILAGEVGGLEQLLEDHEGIWAEVHPILARTYRSTLADLDLAQGRPGEALVHYRRIYERGDRRRLGRSALGLVRALIDLGEGAEARQVAEEAVDLTRGEEAAFRAPALLAHAVALCLHSPREALSRLLEARRAYADSPSAARQAQLALHQAMVKFQLEGKEAGRAELARAREQLTPLTANGLRLLSGPEAQFRELWSLLEHEAPALEMRFLGRREVWLHHKPIKVSELLAEILAVLALAKRPLELGTLQTHLYGDGGNRKALKVAVARLRKLVPITPHPYALAVPFKADFLEIEHNLEKGLLTNALELYGGALLNDSESPVVRHAALERRDPEALLRLHELFSDDLEILEAADTAIEQSDPRASLIKARVTRVRSDYASRS